MWGYWCVLFWGGLSLFILLERWRLGSEGWLICDIIVGKNGIGIGCFLKIGRRYRDSIILVGIWNCKV